MIGALAAKIALSQSAAGARSAGLCHILADRCWFGDPMNDDKKYMVSMAIAWITILIALAFAVIWLAR